MSFKQKYAKWKRASWAERGHRLRTGIREIEERFAHSLGRHRWSEAAFAQRLSSELASGPGTLEERLLEAQRSAEQSRFFFSSEDRDALRDALREHLPSAIPACVQEAERVLRHEARVFEATCDLGPVVCWTRDPRGGEPWPDGYSRALSTSASENGGKDVRYVHELNRHQFLIPLAKAWWLTGEEKYARECRALIESWIDQNPWKEGINWTCALEVGFRTMSWLWIYRFLLDAPCIDGPFHARWVRSLAQHGEYLERHISHYHSPYNHLLGESCALSLLGRQLPVLRDGPHWETRGWNTLCSVIDQQFYADGGSVEQSTFYHHASLGFYALPFCLRRRAGLEIPPGVEERVERAFEFPLALLRPDGTLPMIGDIDDGRSIRLREPEYHWDFRHFLSTGAALFDRADMKAASGGFHEESLWLLGTEGLSRFEHLVAKPPAAATTALCDSGYFVFRTGSQADASVLLFDCGEQAAGLHRDRTPSAAHGHPDCLAVEVCSHGVPFVIDPGFSTYRAASPWRDSFRKTSSHNTVCVDGRDQSRHLGHMAWSNAYRHRLEELIEAPSFSYVAGSHDGFRHRDPPAGTGPGSSPHPVVHRRSVLFVDSTYWVIRDELLGSSEHEISSAFHLAPEIRVERLENGALELLHPEGARLLLATAGLQFDTLVSHGREGDPSSGWVARGYGQREPSSVIRLQKRALLPRLWHTVLYPSAQGAPDVRILETSTGLIVEHDGRRDLIGSSKTAHASAASAPQGVVTDAEWAFVRYGPGERAESAFLIHGRRLDIDEGRSVRVEHPVRWLEARLGQGEPVIGREPGAGGEVTVTEVR